MLLLFRPVLAIVQGPDADKPALALVVDASASMGYSDAANQPNRFRQSALAIQNTLVPRLEKSYRIQVFAYDGLTPDPLPGPDELDKILPIGDVTDLGAAIALPGGRAAQTVLFSDGIHNGPVNIAAELARPGMTGSRVHTVRVGSSDMEPSAVPDIAVVSVDGPQTAIVNNQITLTATIKSTAMSDRTIRVMLNAKDAPPRFQAPRRAAPRAPQRPRGPDRTIAFHARQGRPRRRARTGARRSGGAFGRQQPAGFFAAGHRSQAHACSMSRAACGRRSARCAARWSRIPTWCSSPWCRPSPGVSR